MIAAAIGGATTPNAPANRLGVIDRPPSVS